MFFWYVIGGYVGFWFECFDCDVYIVVGMKNNVIVRGVIWVVW